jgi:hypothetical protein
MKQKKIVNHKLKDVVEAQTKMGAVKQMKIRILNKNCRARKISNR